MPNKQQEPDSQGVSIAALFAATAGRHPDLPYIARRPDGEGAFRELTYGATLARVEALREVYRGAGYGIGTRVAILTGNRPEFHFHYLALNGIGATVIPLNPEARPAEMLYVIEHSETELVVASPHCLAALGATLAKCVAPPPTVDALAETPRPPRSTRTRETSGIDHDGEAAILYTSGTTGRPKGCVLSHRYFVEAARFYAGWGGLLSLQDGRERLLNPLPLFHMNNFVVTTGAMILKAGCNVMIDRFSASRWGADCRDSSATLIHYLGVMPAVLLARPEEPGERTHAVRAGIGAGVDPKHHRAFEERFGYPLLEIWGMTEIGRGFIDNFEPRRIGTRAFGRPDGAVRVRVVNDAMEDVSAGTPGEMLIQSDDPDPRRAFFTGYLKDEAATHAAWCGDWFRTGDVVRQDEDGMLYFVDRRKNIVRRSGENIAAAEVEACLQEHRDVAQAAVLAMADEIREEEVFACVVLKEGTPKNAETARELFEWVFTRLAYFKAPGYVCYREALPTTGTQKIQKGAIFGSGENPLTLLDTHDLRELKDRSGARGPVAAEGMA